MLRLTSSIFLGDLIQDVTIGAIIGKERKRLKRESKEKRREERRKKKLLKNQEILFKMVEGL